MQMLINGQWVEASDKQRIEVRNPATGEIIGTVPRGTLEDARRAVEAAQRGKQAISKLPAHERAAILFRIADAIEQNLNDLGELLAKENGKPIQQTRDEVRVTARIFRGFGEEAKRHIWPRHPDGCRARSGTPPCDHRAAALGGRGGDCSLQLPG